MARIVAVMLFLCKFFFQRSRTIHSVSGGAFRPMAGQVLMGYLSIISPNCALSLSALQAQVESACS
jgi:cytochrome c biogenesis factor